MGLFRRRQDDQGEDEVADGDFTFLSVHKAARLRALTRTAFAEHGLEVTVRSDHVESADGVKFGLTNLAATCHACKERDWPRVVREHVATILRATNRPTEPDDLDEADVMGRVFLRVVGTSTVPDLSRFSYHRPLGGDLVELLALDYPESVAMVNDDVVERFGLEQLRHAGLRNLLAEPFGVHEQVGKRGLGSFHVVHGESVYTASRLLTMNDVLRRSLGEVEVPDGLLVCAPMRHQLAFHVITDASVVATMQAMARFAAAGYGDGVGPVSPFLYWYRWGQWRQLSYPDDERGLRIEVDAELAEVLERLSRGEDGAA